MLKVYNTLTRKQEEFKTREKGKVYIYACGVTPYDFPHIGHGRSAVIYDVMHRYLEYKGYEVIHISNFTDIDDKIINRSNELHINYKELADKYISIYLDNLDTLNVKQLYRYPRATEHIPQIIEMVRVLKEKGYAYEISDGIYYEVSKFKEYGKLSHRDITALREGARVEVNPEKRDPLDFALWKKAKEGEPSWDSSWGKGRPGWHIECSAMSLHYLGSSFDIHGGGDDLIFPHHENEIAQSEAYTGKAPFVRYWLHNGMVIVNREKMSKSLNNFFTMNELFKRYDGEIVRLYLVSISYHKPLSFDLESLEQSSKNYEYFNQSYIRFKQLSGQENGLSSIELAKKWRERFEDAMDNDFNTALVVALLFDIFKFVNVKGSQLSGESLTEVDKLLQDIFLVLGIKKLGTIEEKINVSFKEELMVLVEGLKEEKELTEAISSISLKEEVSDIIKKLIDIRWELKSEKRFKSADLIRNRLKDIGVVLEDTNTGTTYKLIYTRGVENEK